MTLLGQAKVRTLTLLSSKGQYFGLISFKNLPKMRMSEIYCNNNNNNSDNPLTSHCTDGGKNLGTFIISTFINVSIPKHLEIALNFGSRLFSRILIVQTSKKHFYSSINKARLPTADRIGLLRPTTAKDVETKG